MPAWRTWEGRFAKEVERLGDNDGRSGPIAALALQALGL